MSTGKINNFLKSFIIGRFLTKEDRKQQKADYREFICASYKSSAKYPELKREKGGLDVYGAKPFKIEKEPVS